MPLVARKELLTQLLAGVGGTLRSVPYSEGDGTLIAEFAVAHDLEGLVAKRAAAPYHPGWTSWCKVKRRCEEDFLVTAVHRARGGRIDALALAQCDGNALVEQGVVELGAFRVGPLVATQAAGGRAGWSEIEPRILVSVTFTARTPSGPLREAAVKGVRQDGVEALNRPTSTLLARGPASVPERSPTGLGRTARP